MNKESALAALRSIDVAVHSSTHKMLSADELGELHVACRSLSECVKDNTLAAQRAAWMIAQIKSAFMTNIQKPGTDRKYILECGMALALFIQQLPDE